MPARHTGDYSRNGQLVRQWRILQALEHRSFTALELAERHGVHPRTIRRDMHGLEAAGFPLLQEDDAWRLMAPTRLTRVTLNSGESR